MLTYEKFLLVEKVSNDTIRDMIAFGLDKDDIDKDGYVTLYHGGVKLPQKLNKDEIFFMTPDYLLAKDYARIRGGQVFKLKVKPDDVNWNQGSFEVEYDKGGEIVNGVIVPPKLEPKPKNAKYYNFDDEWSTKSHYRLLKVYKNVKLGDKMPKTGWTVDEIVQFKNNKVQFKFNNNYYDADSVVKYEFTND